MRLTEQIDADIKTALKGREEARLSTLRMLKAAMTNLALQREKEVLEDSEVVEVIQKLVKQHQESVEAFTQGNRTDLAQKETQEAEFLKKYLPPAMEDGELKAIIESMLKELGVHGPSALGQVMKAVLGKVKGRADGKRVSQLVKELLM